MKKKHYVYPGYGVCELIDISKKTLNGELVKVYDLKLLSSGMKIVVPENSKELALRSIASKAEANAAIKSLENYASSDIKISSQTWNRRYREYMELVRSGSFQDLVTVAITLKKLKAEKELSFGERKMFDTVTEQLQLELSVILGKEINLQEKKLRLV